MKPKMETVPWPEMPKDVNIIIPKELVTQFKNEVRIVVRFPWIVGIPVPEFLLEKLGMAGRYKDFDVLMVPKEVNR